MTTIVGNLTEAPRLAFTNSGTPVCNMRLALNRRWKGKDGSDQEATTYLNAVAWNDLAQNLAASCDKGTRVWLAGHWEPEEYETAGKKVESLKLVAGDGGISLQRCTCVIEKVARAYVAPPSAYNTTPTTPTKASDGPLHKRAVDAFDDEAPF